MNGEESELANQEPDPGMIASATGMRARDPWEMEQRRPRQRHMVLELDAGAVVEVTCTQPGNWDGCLMGYAIRFGGTWDGWWCSRHNHRQLNKVVWNVTKEEAIAAIAAQWAREE